jgi:hypothetical protein
MDSWTVVIVLVVSVTAGAVSGWVLLGQDSSTRRPRHLSTGRAGLTRQGRHRHRGRFIERLVASRHAAAGQPVHVKARRTHARTDR